MASDINKVILIGRLSGDPILKYTKSGTSIASFGIASNYTYKSGDTNNDRVSFFNCIAWGNLADIISQYTKKGHRVGIEGTLQQDRWDDKDGNPRSTIKINVEKFQFLQPKDIKAIADDIISSGTEVDNAPVNNPFLDDDIPF